MQLLHPVEALAMPMPAVILCTDTSVAPLLVGGLPLATRHIKELDKRGVRVFYLYGLTALPTAMLPDAFA